MRNETNTAPELTASQILAWDNFCAEVANIKGLPSAQVAAFNKMNDGLDGTDNEYVATGFVIQVSVLLACGTLGDIALCQASNVDATVNALILAGHTVVTSEVFCG